MRHLLGFLAFAMLSTSVQAKADDKNNNPQDDLRAFRMLTFLGEDDNKNYSANLQDIVGQYIILGAQSNGEKPAGHPRLIGERMKTLTASAVVELKNRNVINDVVDKSWNFDIGIPALAFKLDDDHRVELDIHDIATVSNTAADLTRCIADKPPGLGDQIHYACITKATLTEINKRTFKKRNGGLSAGLSFVSGNVAYKAESNKVTTSYVINVSTTIELVGSMAAPTQIPSKDNTHGGNIMALNRLDDLGKLPLPSLRGVVLGSAVSK